MKSKPAAIGVCAFVFCNCYEKGRLNRTPPNPEIVAVLPNGDLGYFTATPDQHAAFVPRANEANPHWVIDLRVLVIHPAQAGPGHDPGSDRPFDELAARDVRRSAHGGVEILFANFAFFGRKVHGWCLVAGSCPLNRGLAPGG
jgi:hypothetical protein